MSSFFRTTISSKATSCEHDEHVGVARVCCAARLALAPKALLGLGFGDVLLATGSLHEPTNRCQLPWQAWAMPVAVRWRSTSRSKPLVSRSSRPKASAKRLWSLVNALSSAFTSACQGTMAPSPDCSECMWSWPRSRGRLQRGLRFGERCPQLQVRRLLNHFISCASGTHASKTAPRPAEAATAAAAHSRPAISVDVVLLQHCRYVACGSAIPALSECGMFECYDSTVGIACANVTGSRLAWGCISAMTALAVPPVMQ